MFNIGDAVAVMPIGSREPQDAQSIASVSEADNDTMRLTDRTIYRFHDGLWSSEDGFTHLVKATQGHIAAVHARCTSA